MPAKPPRCKLCGAEHWNSEPHVLPDQKPVTVPRKLVTQAVKPVTQDAQPVTPPEKPVTVQEVPVTRGKRGPARVYATNAERQRAYRARRQAP